MKTNYKFKNFNYNLNDKLTFRDIEFALAQFYMEELLKVDPKLKFCIIFKIKATDGSWRSISPLQILDKTNFFELRYIFNLFFNISIYKGIIIDKIIFRYRYLEPSIAPRKCILEKPTHFYTNKMVVEDYINLPNNRLFETWGDSLAINGDNTFLIEEGSCSFFVRQLDNEYFVSYRDDELEILYFQDIYDPNDKTNNTFLRIIGNSELYYRNGLCYILDIYLK